MKTNDPTHSNFELAVFAKPFLKEDYVKKIKLSFSLEHNWIHLDCATKKTYFI